MSNPSVTREECEALNPDVIEAIVTRMKIGYRDDGYFSKDAQRLYDLAAWIRRNPIQQLQADKERLRGELSNRTITLNGLIVLLEDVVRRAKDAIPDDDAARGVQLAPSGPQVIGAHPTWLACQDACYCMPTKPCPKLASSGEEGE